MRLEIARYWGRDGTGTVEGERKRRRAQTRVDKWTPLSARPTGRGYVCVQGFTYRWWMLADVFVVLVHVMVMQFAKKTYRQRSMRGGLNKCK